VDPARWQRLQQLFEGALDIPPERRGQWLVEACPDDTELRRRAESLILHESQPSIVAGVVGAAAGMASAGLAGAADAAAGGAAGEGVTQAPDYSLLWEPAPGDRLGPYNIIRLLGRGGMGAVYLAERDDDQFHKTVAIKLVRASLLLIPEMMARFRSERQILASLDHPNIARLFDGGAAPNGTPYVVMEYVDGTPLDEYCAHKNLSVPERLRLFRKICGAVHYAHQNLIVHRDIKPDNVLVTQEGEPKLLDFGIAKLLDPTAAGQTQTRARLMTPDYASPEQVRGEPVTTATDVYALGVLLYELLTGDLPYKLKTSEAYELEQAICLSEPRRPSSIQAGLRGDLENIILMALRKEPVLRYASVEQFSEDVRRYLDGYPVIARTGVWSYRASKFVRRNAAAVGAAALAAVLILVFAIGMSLQARRIAKERDAAALERQKSQQVAAFLTDLFRLADPTRTKGGAITARELLDSGAKRLETELAGQPEIQAAMMNEIGAVYRSLGLYQEARVIAEKGLAIRRRVLGNEHPDVAASLTNLSILSRDLGDYDAAFAAVREAVAIRRQAPGSQSPDIVPSLNSLAVLLEDKAEYKESERLHREAVAILRAQPRLDERALATSLNNLGGVLGRAGRGAEALPLYQEALALRRKVLGRDHLESTQTLNNLANVYRDRGDVARAVEAFQEIVAARSKIFGANHPEVGKALTNYAATLTAAKRYDEAIPLLNQARDIFVERLGPDHLNVAFVLDNLATVHYSKGDYAAAEPLYRRVTEMFRARFGDDHPETALGYYNMAGNYLGWRKFDLAEQHARKAERAYRAKLGPSSPMRLTALVRLASVLREKRDPAAEALLREALDTGSKTWKADSLDRASARAGLGAILSARGNYGEAEPLLVESYAVLNREGGDAANAREAREQILALYKASNQPDKARAFLQANPKEPERTPAR